jgi:Sulfotransferase family
MGKIKRAIRKLVTRVRGGRQNVSPVKHMRTTGNGESQTEATLAQAVLTHKFVFVCGLHRSGTTLLADTLRTHPLVSGFHDTPAPKDEGQHLQSVFPPARAYQGPGKFGFASKAHLTEASRLATVANAEKLFKEWSSYWDLSKPYLLEKSPPNLIRTRFFQFIFPPSYFVVLVRHPMAVAYATQKWSKSSLESLVNHWVTCHDIFAQDRVHLKNVCVLRYEDFVSNPQQALGSICSFLNLPAVLQSPEVDLKVNQRYRGMWLELKQSAAGKKIASRIERLYGKAMLSYGYNLDEWN